MSLNDKEAIVPVEDLDEEMDLWCPLQHLRAKQARRHPSSARSEPAHHPSAHKPDRHDDAYDVAG
jgi:hypothetical protein